MHHQADLQNFVFREFPRQSRSTPEIRSRPSRGQFCPQQGFNRLSRVSVKASQPGREASSRASDPRNGSQSWRSIPLRGKSQLSQAPSQTVEYTARNGSPKGNVGVMQPAIWVDASDGASFPSQESGDRQHSPQQAESLERGRTGGDSEAVRGKSTARHEVVANTRAAGRESRASLNQQSWEANSVGSRQQRGDFGHQQSASPSSEWLTEGPDINFQRGNQRGIHEEQPGNSGRQDAQASKPLGGIFRGRKLNFWARDSASRNTRGSSDADGLADNSGRPSSWPNTIKSSADDWVASEVMLHEEEDGWGRSDIDKQGRKEAVKSNLWKPGRVDNARPARQDEGFSQGDEALDFGLREDSSQHQEGGESSERFKAEEGAEPGLYGASSEEQRNDQQASPGVLDAEVVQDEPDWGSADEDWEEGTLPDITPLAPDEADELLPVIPTPEQMSQNWGNAIEFGQRAAAALALTIITSKFNLVLFATGSATFVFWGPVLGAVNRNRVLRNSGRFVGLWRATVKAIYLDLPERRSFSSQRGYAPLNRAPSLKLLIGDESGARSQLILPYNRRHEAIQLGDAAELLVLSPQSSFKSFKALKEVYLPESGLWLSDYPHINRNLFLEVSLEIERERKMSMAEGAFEVAA